MGMSYDISRGAKLIEQDSESISWGLGEQNFSKASSDGEARPSALGEPKENHDDNIEHHWSALCQMCGAPERTRRALAKSGSSDRRIVGAAAAIANAVYHATCIRVRDLPITLDKLLP